MFKHRPNLKQKTKVATSSCSSGITSPTSSEGEQPPENMKGTLKGKEATLNTLAKAPPNPSQAAKFKGQRALYQPAVVVMPPPQKTPNVHRAKCQALRPLTSSSTANVRATTIVSNPGSARLEEASNASEMEPSLSFTNKIARAEVDLISKTCTGMCRQ